MSQRTEYALDNKKRIREKKNPEQIKDKKKKEKTQGG